MSETCQTCHSLCPPAVVESGECIWCIAGQFKRENAAMREAIQEAFNSFAEDPESDAAWLLTERQRTALAKLHPFITP